MPNYSEKSVETPSYVVPKRTQISDQNLHISSFVVVKREDGDSVLFLRAGEKHRVSFKRGKLLLPATILNFGENPRDAAKRALGDQLDNSEYLQPKFLTMQSYLGAHWDLVFVFEAQMENGKQELMAKPPYVQVAYHGLSSLPRHEIAEDHLEVIDGVGSNLKGS